jgi:hypothetical protein
LEVTSERYHLYKVASRPSNFDYHLHHSHSLHVESLFPKMTSEHTNDRVGQHYTNLIGVHKRSKRVLSGEEKDLVNEAKKLRKTSSELIAKVKQLEADEDKAKEVENVWAKRTQIFETLLYVMSQVARHEG